MSTLAQNELHFKREGWDAFRNEGIRMDRCPYQGYDASVARANWVQGWMAARDGKERP